MKKRQAAIEEAYAAQVRYTDPSTIPFHGRDRVRPTDSVVNVNGFAPAPQWDDGKGSHHPDYNPYAKGENVIKASRETEELLNAIVKVRSRGLSGRPRKSIPRDGHKTTGGAFF